MKNVFITLLIALLITSYNANAQSYEFVDNWMDILEEMGTETEDPSALETLYSDLSYLIEYPFDINKVTVDELVLLPFLTDKQIDAIINYRSRYGNMATLYELKNIPELDHTAIRLLLPFVSIGEKPVHKLPITVGNLLKYGSNELLIRYDRGFQQKKGYCSLPDSILTQYPNRKYLGEPFYNSVRYSYGFNDRVQAGLVMEKDAGEPFWNSAHKGYDFYSGHVFIKGSKLLKSLAIGDYKVSFGQGLIISNDYSPGRNSLVVNTERRSNGFRRHYSTNEYDYFRGVAATWNIKDIDVSMFYSYRKLDGNTDSTYISSISKDGLHRLVREREKKHTVAMQTFGGNVRYALPDFHIGITALHYTFGKYSMEPEPKPYNLFYFRGNHNTNIGVDYMLKSKYMKIYGETAFSGNGKIATLTGIQLTPVSYISFLGLYRYYDKQYHSFFGNAFSQNSTIQNEQGVYLGMSLTPVAYWKVSMYADIFRFPWLKYRVDAPSEGAEYMIQVDYNQLKNFSFYVRYKYKQKEMNTTNEGITKELAAWNQQRLRLQCLYNINNVYFRSSAEGIIYGQQDTSVDKGLMFTQSISWKKQTSPFQADFYMAWFDTDNYNTRIYSYEKNMLYAFYTPSFYGNGIRLTTILKYNITRYLSFSGKLAFTHYTDREVIGTGLEEIEGNSKMDLYTMIRWKF